MLSVERSGDRGSRTRYRLTVEGYSVEVSTFSPESRSLGWADDWSTVCRWAYVDRLLEQEHHGPGTYGHADLLIPLAALPGDHPQRVEQRDRAVELRELYEAGEYDPRAGLDEHA